jgi:hypothetical protein
VPRMLRSAPRLRRDALLIRGPWLQHESVGPGSAVHRDRTMLRIAGRTLHRVRDTSITRLRAHPI